MDATLDTLEKRKQTLDGKLRSSKTAFARGVEPTSQDMMTSSQLNSIKKQIESLKGRQLSNKWYGEQDKNKEVKSAPDGLIIKGLKALQKPTSAIVGSIQYGLGKGTESSFTKNVDKSVKTGLLAGDVLEQFNVPRVLQMPLGFALDVMLDPVNWATAGTAALIPRIGTGLVKGTMKGGLKKGIKAATKGLTSNIQGKAATTMKFVPFAKKSLKYKNLRDTIGEKAIRGSDKFDELTGTNIYDRLGKTPFGFQGGAVGKVLGKAISGKNEFVNKVPGLGFLSKPSKRSVNLPFSETKGERAIDFFEYSTKKSNDMADLNDKTITLSKNDGVILVRTKEGSDFVDIKDFYKKDATITVPDKIGEYIDVAIREADGTLKKEYFGKIKINDNFDNAKYLLEAAGEDYSIKNLFKSHQTTELGKTGVKGYDDFIDKLKNTTFGDITSGKLGPVILKELEKDSGNLVQKWNSYNNITKLKPFKKMLETEEHYRQIFKGAKVPMNVSSHVVAYLGNFVMGSMMGLPVHKARYIDNIRQASKFVKGKQGPEGVKNIMLDVSEDVKTFLDMSIDNPTRFKLAAGLDPSEILSKMKIDRSIAKTMSIASEDRANKDFLIGIIDDVKNTPDIYTQKIKELKSETNKIVDIVKDFPIDGNKIIKDHGKKFKSPLEKTMDRLKEAPLKRSEEYGSLSSSELQSNALDNFRNMIKGEIDKTTNPAKKLGLEAINTLVERMPKMYEHIDQSFKIGTTNYISKIGLTEKELINISRSVKITKADILEPIIEGGEKLYRLTPLKASEIALEAYMNYSAMPDFVRVMRALPVAGSPFFSFQYAMAIKTGKTAINNPAIFNNISFMLGEMNAGRTPEEKIALENKYNQYLNSPTVAKVFGMWNTDVKNIVPYYTMNMFNPSDRTYDDSPQGKILKITDKSPFFQHPVGQIIKDYFVQPWILSGTGQAPQGQFGQPLFPSFDKDTGKPKEAGLGIRTGYATRTLAESLVPGALGYLGFPLGMTGISQEMINLVPSYGARSAANKVRGNTSIGKPTREDPFRKAGTGLANLSGIKTYLLDTEKTNIKK